MVAEFMAWQPAGGNWNVLYQVPESLTPGVFKAAAIWFNVAKG